MAKLEGVKTVDMVDGEITKISYDGAEYVKVAHDFKDARTGDIFFYNGRNGYYEITIRKRDFYGIDHPVRFTEDDGTDNGYMRSCPMHPLFRKIHAQSTPTLAEVSDKVDAIEQRVSALEGDDLKVGDYVTFTKDVFEHTKGKVSVIRQIDSGATMKYGLDSPTGESDGWARDGDIRKATDEEVTEATAPKFEVGDYVKVLADGEFGGVDVGEYGKVVKGHAEDGNRYSVRVDGKDDHDYFRPQDLEKLEGKDVERIVQFAKAGRNLDEFKKGDIVQVIERGSHDFVINEVVEIVDFSGRGSNKIKAKEIGGEVVGCPYLYEREITLIAPVESRVDSV